MKERAESLWVRKLYIIVIHCSDRRNVKTLQYNCVDAENIKVKIILKLKPVVKNGVTYVDVDDLKLFFTTTRLRLKLDNLFKGDRALGESLGSR